MSLSAESSRAQFFVQLGGLIGVSSSALFPSAANAAKYGGFGAGSPEVLDPKEAIVDSEILASSAVQKALQGVKSYLSAVQSIQEALEKNPQADVGPFLRKEFDFSKLRTDLNTLNTAFDEDTQRGTDRLIRNIMQDITELETANKQKEGVERSERRLDIMKGKLAKLTQAFSDYLAFTA
jgi:hypothetical protein